jgi:hypothetical protein
MTSEPHSCDSTAGGKHTEVVKRLKWIAVPDKVLFKLLFKSVDELVFFRKGEAGSNCKELADGVLEYHN